MRKASGDDKAKGKASALSKQVIKPNAIPQLVKAPLEEGTSTGKVKKQPLRSTKVSQKLVVFPQASTEPASLTSAVLPSDGGDTPEPPVAMDDDFQRVPASPVVERRFSGTDGYGLDYSPHQQVLYSEQWHAAASTGVTLPTEWTFQSRTKAERMTKDERDFAQLPRVAAYCTGEGYSLARLRTFLRDHHHASTRLYDEALYAAYHFPLMTLRPDKDNWLNIRVRSASPRPPASNLFSSPHHREDEMHDHDHHPYNSLARSHQSMQDDQDMNYDEDHFNDHGAPQLDHGPARPGYPFHDHSEYAEAQFLSTHEPHLHDDDYHHHDHHHDTHLHDDDPHQHVRSDNDNDELDQHGGAASSHESSATAASALENDTSHHNHHHHHDEQDPLPPSPSPLRKPFTGGEVFIFDYGVVVFWNFHRAEELLMLEDLAAYCIGPFRDNPDEDLQIEEMHFQYDTSQLKPRIFNDMITMKTEMAETGRLGKSRSEITKINGQLFQLRMNVNLVSNVLDTPEIFWSEPSLQPMYNAIREYLEISQRAKILNDRLRVISDMLSMLRDHLTNFGVEYQTLIIIYLIIVAVIVACFEIAVKILQSLKVY
ncbi:hypothetical protein BC940DRAFT_326623 [Gongronella butleri]|nr:hypothetical protein BC940DRAFT_326623 [Gongronella butleri]